MAEALAKDRLGTQIDVRSAGLNPQPEYDSKSAISTLKDDFGIDASGHRQTHVRDVDLESFTYVIALDAAIADRLQASASRQIIRWHVEDPWEGDRAEYQLCAVEIVRHLDQFLGQVNIT